MNPATKQNINNVKYDYQNKKFNDASSIWWWQFEQTGMYLQ
jgi:hypothetical protein